MAYGMPKGGKMKAMSKFPQGDKTAGKMMKTKTGPDDDTKTKVAENMTTPTMGERDGPARGGLNGMMAGKPATSAPPAGGQGKIKSAGVQGKSAAPAPKTTMGKSDARMPSGKTMKSMKSSLGMMGSF